MSRRDVPLWPIGLLCTAVVVWALAHVAVERMAVEVECQRGLFVVETDRHIRERIYKGSDGRYHVALYDQGETPSGVLIGGQTGRVYQVVGNRHECERVP